MKIRSIPVGSPRLIAIVALVVGSLFQPGAVQAVPAAQVEGQLITVTVKVGESLLVYTRLYGVTGSAILAMNQIKDPNIIFPGQVLTIPVIATFTPSLTTPFFYVAQAGDTFASIGRQFAMDPDVIIGANGGKATVTPGATYLIPAGPHEHVVQAGETLKIIAARYGVTVAFLLTGNSLPNPDFIYPGQTIFVPIIYGAKPIPLTGTPPPTIGEATATPAPTSAATVTPAPAVTATPAISPTNPNFITTTVRRGESFLIYAFRYGVRGASLRAANPHIKDPNVIYPGQTIVIPVEKSFTPSRTTPFFYVVGAGENSVTIAAKFEMRASILTQANPDVTFTEGATILVPAGPHRYTVRPGDTLKIIAAKYGTTVEFLLTGNSLPNPDFIYPDQTIFVPIRYNAMPLPFAP